MFFELAVLKYPRYYILMIHNFLTVGTEDIFNGNSTKSARKTLPPSLWRVAARNLDQLDSVQSLEELKVPPR